MIPRGPIYTRIRQDLLSTFPNSLASRSGDRVGFSEWLLNASGSFVVSSINNTEFIIRASPIDIAQSLLVEIELFSNHCFEHLKELGICATNAAARSDAWNVVTIYYFGFFSAQVFTRLIGNPVVYIGRDSISKIKALGSAPSTLGVGSYVVERIGPGGGTFADFRIKRTSNSKIHEATWIRVFQYFRDLMQDPSILTDVEEVLLYRSLTSTNLRNIYNDGWPSIIRTKANYSAGYAYLAVEGNSVAKCKKLIESWKDVDLSNIAQHLDVSVTACAPPSYGNYAGHVRLLHDVSQTLFLICRQLYSELLNRTKIGTTWENRRKAFRKTMVLSERDYPAIGTIVNRS
jgi:hypothetical protein